MLERISYYCANRERIEERMMRNWEKIIAQMKKNKSIKGQPQCPYLFLTREEIPAHELWTDFEEGLQLKLTTCHTL